MLIHQFLINYSMINVIFCPINGEQTCTHCTCQPCTQGEHVACIAVLFLLLVLLVILIVVVVVITTSVPFFYIALGDISQEGLMSKEEIEEIQKKWKGSLWSIALKHFCIISCTKDPSVVTRIVDILQKCGLSGREEVMLLKGRQFILNVHNPGDIQDVYMWYIV